jgi:hypothetical protein
MQKLVFTSCMDDFIMNWTSTADLYPIHVIYCSETSELTVQPTWLIIQIFPIIATSDTTAKRKWSYCDRKENGGITTCIHNFRGWCCHLYNNYIRAMQRQRVVLAYLGSQCTELYIAVWTWWFLRLLLWNRLSGLMRFRDESDKRKSECVSNCVQPPCPGLSMLIRLDLESWPWGRATILPMEESGLTKSEKVETGKIKGIVRF